MTDEKKHIDLEGDLLAKFLMNECSEEELQAVDSWLNESPQHVDELFNIEEMYYLGRRKELTEEDLDREERRLMKRVQATNQLTMKRSLWHEWLQYAAILLGMMLVGGLSYCIYNNQYPEEELLTLTTQDEMKELILSDGTKVWLNKHSSFRYPAEFTTKQRTVYLEGEGHFEVQRDTLHPFVVHSDAMCVKVLGTVFNLKTDKVAHTAVATLMQGAIEVKGNRNEGQIVLIPGQQAELDGSNHRLVVKQIETGIEYWHNHSFAFENADIFTIARTLEKFYGVDIVLSSDLNTEKTYSGVLKKSESVANVLDLLQNVIPITYKIKDDKTVLLLNR